MGIPGLWRWLQQLCPAACKTATRVDQPSTHSLFVDLNSTIHHSARQSNGSMASVLHAIDAVVKQVRPQHLLFLAIDGVPPRLKERLQRERRARLEPGADGAEPAAFSAYFVTPGTAWMRQLETRLAAFIDEKRRTDREWTGLRVVVSGARDPGEGEHKIMEYVRRVPRHGWARHVVWSNDADTVLLALAAHAPHVTVVSERFHGAASTYTAVDVDRLRSHVLERYAPPEARAWMGARKIVDDLVFMALFVGNDFLPPLVPAAPSEDGAAVDRLWTLYAVYLAEHRAHLHRRGRIDPAALQVLLQVLVREHEDRQFRRYVGVTQLGPQIMATRVRRIAWDIQRQKLENPDADTSAQQDTVPGWDLSVPTSRKKAKHKGKGKGKTRPRMDASANGKSRIPYVWTGCAGELAAQDGIADVSQLPGAAPLAADLFPVYAPPSKRVDGLMLKLDSRPLVSVEMLPIFNWILDIASADSSSVKGIAGSSSAKETADSSSAKDIADPSSAKGIADSSSARDITGAYSETTTSDSAPDQTSAEPNPWAATAEPNAIIAIAGLGGCINYNKVAWLRSLAKALGMKLEAYDMSDAEFKSMYKRWKRSEHAVLFPGEASGSRPSLVLTLERQPADKCVIGNRVSVVDSSAWDTLLSDASTEHERGIKVAEWKAAYYWQRSSPEKRTGAFAGRISALYAQALGWTAQYFFAGTVSSWEFAWPEDADCAHTGMAPLPSDLLACVRGMGAEWTAVPESDRLPPLLREHLLSVIPRDAWPMLGAEEQALARLLCEGKYSHAIRVQVHNRLANTIEEAPMVNIWL
ncbi:5'-3' exoribonuclease 1 [Coemansia erecta]|nr:5'-3' exoribonuclease 1 [Coemansia sp. RSA 2618]KAJ2830821.1 5'-3' exoribonuclease 1 [Coemansia erecta]